MINQGYVVGSFKYGGIVSIFSEAKDLAGELSESNQFFSYRLFTRPPEGISGDGGGLPGPRVAARRNLLGWEPRLELDGEHSVRFSFYTSDAPGEYEICIRSFGTRGEGSVFRTVSFSVK